MAGKIPNDKGGHGAMKLALAGYTVLFAGKMAAFALTHLGAMYAEALHSLADMLIAGFLLVAAMWSRKPADQEYRYGYGRAQNVAALVAATVFISFTSFETLREAIPKLTHPGTTQYSNLGVAIAVNVVALVISAIPLVTITLGKSRGAASRAQLVESVNDVIALVAVLIGTVLVARGVHLADGIAMVAVGVIIAINAGILWTENARNLMGRSPGPEVLAKIDAAVKSVPGVLGVHAVRAENVGEDIHLELHIDVAPGTPIESADAIAHQVERGIRAEVGSAFCTIHVDPIGTPEEDVTT